MRDLSVKIEEFTKKLVVCRFEFGTIFASFLVRSGSGRFYIKTVLSYYVRVSILSLQTKRAPKKVLFLFYMTSLPTFVFRKIVNHKS